MKTISVTIPLQHNGMVEASAIGAAMQNLYDAAMGNGFGLGASIGGKCEDGVLTLAITQPETITDTIDEIPSAPRRGRPPKSR